MGCSHQNQKRGGTFVESLSNHHKEKELLRLQVESYHMYQVEKMCLDILSDIITEVRFQTEYGFTPINSAHRIYTFSLSYFRQWERGEVIYFL